MLSLLIGVGGATRGIRASPLFSILEEDCTCTQQNQDDVMQQTRDSRTYVKCYHNLLHQTKQVGCEHFVHNTMHGLIETRQCFYHPPSQEQITASLQLSTCSNHRYQDDILRTHQTILTSSVKFAKRQNVRGFRQDLQTPIYIFRWRAQNLLKEPF